MQRIRPFTRSHVAVLIAGAVLAVGGTRPLTSAGQERETPQAKQPNSHAQHKDHQPSDAQKHDMSKMGGQKHDMGAMSGQKQSGWWFEEYNRHQKQGMAGMKGMTADETNDGAMARHGSSSGGPVMSDDIDVMGLRLDAMSMMGMGAAAGAESTNMKRLSGMKLASAQPGIPGVSHLYHIGATGLFLNHAEHLSLTTKQLAALNVMKQKALFSKATTQRKIDQAEQELWELTGADEPDTARIQSKVEAIEKLRGEQRIAFIVSVDQTTKLLTDEQREILLGTKEPDAAPADVPSDK